MYKLLIAEDEKWIRMGIRAMIDTKTNPISEILEAEDVRQGLAVWREKRPEIVLSDICMPYGDGCALCETIYAEAPETKFVVISGYNEFDYARRAMNFRAVDYLLKPVEKERLNEVIAQCIQEIAKEQGNARMVNDIIENNLAYSEQDVVNKAVHFIEENYSNKLSLATLAEEIHVSETYLSSLFKKSTGMSPIQYITSIRINRAIDLLQNSAMKINDIAAIVGYPDQTYFTKVFKRVTGKNPTDYR
ncbi:MAG: helix-turn-helix domain-containing protein [Oscillospiraceae bacterium]